jgi:hypothetical protein
MTTPTPSERATMLTDDEREVLFQLDDGSSVYRGDVLHVAPRYMQQAGSRVTAEKPAYGDVVTVRSDNGAVPMLPVSALSREPHPDVTDATEIASLLGGYPHQVSGRDLRLYRALLARLGEQQPAFWVRWRSDGCYEGPLHDSSIEDVRKRSGAWSPLYTHPSPAPVGAQDRKVAEHAYITTAFDYASAPVGSRDWTLFWGGWQAARSAAQGAVQVPAGMALVPVEPTKEMLQAFKDAYKEGDFWRERIHGAVAAMLAAAPAHAGERSEGGA